jgi:hypothetical protein
MLQQVGQRPYGPDPDVCQSRKIASLAAYWAGKRRGERLPRRADLAPEEIVPLLPYILLADIEPEPLRIRYRLVGTAIAEGSRRDITGLHLDEIQFDYPGEREAFEAGYRLMLDTAAPVYGRMVWLASQELPVLYESAIFPLLGESGDLEKAIAIEDYERPVNELAGRLPSRPARRDD